MYRIIAALFFATCLNSNAFSFNQPVTLQTYLGEINNESVFIGGSRAKGVDYTHILSLKDSSYSERIKLGKSDTTYLKWFVHENRLYSVAAHFQEGLSRILLLGYNADYDIVENKELYSKSADKNAFQNLFVKHAGNNLAVVSLLGEQAEGAVVFYNIATADTYFQALAIPDLSGMHCNDIIFNDKGEMLGVLERYTNLLGHGYYKANDKLYRTVTFSCSKDGVSTTEIPVVLGQECAMNYKLAKNSANEVLIAATIIDTKSLNCIGYRLGILAFGNSAAMNWKSALFGNRLDNPEFWYSENHLEKYKNGKEILNGQHIRKIEALSDGSFLLFSENKHTLTSSSPAVSGMPGSVGMSTPSYSYVSGADATDLIVTKIDPQLNIAWSDKMWKLVNAYSAGDDTPSCIYSIDKQNGSMHIVFGGYKRYDIYGKKTFYMSEIDLDNGKLTTREQSIIDIPDGSLLTDVSHFDSNGIAHLLLTENLYPSKKEKNKLPVIRMFNSHSD